ncbi:hypothetical protein HPG69_009000 [Diceros bicornis minor]|uniref:Glucokinase regulatory protein n=1 Tax=Diceros bicornis minor TaxID=77932 RepID=A0A7J7EBC7_DICBM|nr:hypothetical protein HPG69_009000 [Diceros bicornis minor]
MVSTESAGRRWGIRLTSRRGSWRWQELWRVKDWPERTAGPRGRSGLGGLLGAQRAAHRATRWRCPYPIPARARRGGQCGTELRAEDGGVAGAGRGAARRPELGPAAESVGEQGAVPARPGGWPGSPVREAVRLPPPAPAAGCDRPGQPAAAFCRAGPARSAAARPGRAARPAPLGFLPPSFPRPRFSQGSSYDPPIGGLPGPHPVRSRLNPPSPRGRRGRRRCEGLRHLGEPLPPDGISEVGGAGTTVCPQSGTMPGTKWFQHVIETPEPGKWELSGYEAALPITEKSNPLTQDLDKADAKQIVQLLGQCDAEIFQEEGQTMRTYQRLYSESVLTTMVQVAGKVQEVLKEPEGALVVLSGGGTSGRMAFLMSVSFNQLMKGLGQKPLYTYLIAGGDRSVVASREGTEDSALHRIEELKKVAAGKKRVIVIGISVGLSAPFVAGQMDYCMDNPAVFLPVLVGFNPVSMARNDPIEDWSSTFRQIAERMQKLQEKQEAFPEGLSGSSRMKGGSATKILLETLLLAAHKTVDRGLAASQRCLLEILRTYERAHQVTYSQSPKIATLMKQASTSLEKRGHVYLVGWQTLGIIAIMDGVECIHTFGADFRDVRGFLIGDHSDIFNQKAELINQGPQFSFSQEDFLTSILPSLMEIDTVVFIFTLDNNLTEVQTLVEQVKEKTSNIQGLAHSTVGQSLPTSLKKLFPSIISITWPLLFFEYEGNFIQKFQHELSTKWVLNTVSTGAHVLLGKILQNHMLDLRIRNSKLFWRALAMLQRFSGQPKARCIESLLQVIHFPQPLSDDIRASPISFHIQVAHEKEQVIPIALLSLLFQCSIPEAQAHLAAAPSVCEAVRSALTGPGRKRSADPLETLEPALQQEMTAKEPNRFWFYEGRVTNLLQAAIKSLHIFNRCPFPQPPLPQCLLSVIPLVFILHKHVFLTLQLKYLDGTKTSSEFNSYILAYDIQVVLNVRQAGARSHGTVGLKEDVMTRQKIKGPKAGARDEALQAQQNV